MAPVATCWVGSVESCLEVGRGGRAGLGICPPRDGHGSPWSLALLSCAASLVPMLPPLLKPNCGAHPRWPIRVSLLRPLGSWYHTKFLRWHFYWDTEITRGCVWFTEMTQTGGISCRLTLTQMELGTFWGRESVPLPCSGLPVASWVVWVKVRKPIPQPPCPGPFLRNAAGGSGTAGPMPATVGWVCQSAGGAWLCVAWTRRARSVPGVLGQRCLGEDGNGFPFIRAQVEVGQLPIVSCIYSFDKYLLSSSPHLQVPKQKLASAKKPPRPSAEGQAGSPQDSAT